MTKSRTNANGATAAIKRFYYVATAGQTVFNGTDSNGLTLAYVVGKEQLYLNGTMLVRGQDYTATTGTSVTLTNASLLNDTLEIISLVGLSTANVLTGSTLAAKGSMIVASAPTVAGDLAIGTNGQVLTADSTAGVGAKWATPASPTTLISTVALNGSTSYSISIPANNYSALKINVLIQGTSATAMTPLLTFNGNTSSIYTSAGFETTSVQFRGGTVSNIGSWNELIIDAPNSTAWAKGFKYNWSTVNLNSTAATGIFRSTDIISSVGLAITNTGHTGTFSVYGIL